VLVFICLSSAKWYQIWAKFTENNQHQFEKKLFTQIIKHSARMQTFYSSN